MIVDVLTVKPLLPSKNITSTGHNRDWVQTSCLLSKAPLEVLSTVDRETVGISESRQSELYEFYRTLSSSP